MMNGRGVCGVTGRLWSTPPEAWHMYNCALDGRSRRHVVAAPSDSTRSSRAPKSWGAGGGHLHPSLSRSSFFFYFVLLSSFYLLGRFHEPTNADTRNLEYIKAIRDIHKKITIYFFIDKSGRREGWGGGGKKQKQRDRRQILFLRHHRPWAPSIEAALIKREITMPKNLPKLKLKTPKMASAKNKQIKPLDIEQKHWGTQTPGSSQ